jgi:hypothetical protein
LWLKIECAFEKPSMSLFGLLCTALAASGLSNLKFDVLCYGPHCEEFRPDFEADLSEGITNMRAWLSADSSNFASAIGQCTSYYLWIFLTAAPSRSGQDILDLTRLTGHKFLEILSEAANFGARRVAPGRHF